MGKEEVGKEEGVKEEVGRKRWVRTKEEGVKEEVGKYSTYSQHSQWSHS